MLHSVDRVRRFTSIWVPFGSLTHYVRVNPALCSFHTFMSHSERLYLVGMKLDFQGILLLMWSSTVPLAYYGFRCGFSPSVRATYLAATTLLAAACSVATLLPRFSGPDLGPTRAALFASFGTASFVAPIAHGVLAHGFREHAARVGLSWILITAGFNGLGMVIYTLKVSERK